MGESRSEDILENILGAENELVPPQSRIEILLQQLLEAMGSGSGGSGGGTATFIQLTRSGTDVSVDMTYQELLTALSSGGTTYVVMETPPVIDNGPTYVVVCHLDGYSEADSSVWFTAEWGGKTYRIELISTLDQLDNEHYYMAGSYQEAGGGGLQLYGPYYFVNSTSRSVIAGTSQYIYLDAISTTNEQVTLPNDIIDYKFLLHAINVDNLSYSSVIPPRMYPGDDVPTDAAIVIKNESNSDLTIYQYGAGVEFYCDHELEPLPIVPSDPGPDPSDPGGSPSS